MPNSKNSPSVAAWESWFAASPIMLGESIGNLPVNWAAMVADSPLQRLERGRRDNQYQRPRSLPRADFLPAAAFCRSAWLCAHRDRTRLNRAVVLDSRR